MLPVFSARNPSLDDAGLARVATLVHANKHIRALTLRDCNSNASAVFHAQEGNESNDGDSIKPNTWAQLANELVRNRKRILCVRRVCVRVCVCAYAACRCAFACVCL